jgi:hypothetical protein
MLRDHRRMCGLSLTETSLCRAWLYVVWNKISYEQRAVSPVSLSQHCAAATEQPRVLHLHANVMSCYAWLDTIAKLRIWRPSSSTSQPCGCFLSFSSYFIISIYLASFYLSNNARGAYVQLNQSTFFHFGLLRRCLLRNVTVPLRNMKS